MNSLKPEIIVRAARVLYGTAYSDILVFLTLKAGGLTMENGVSTEVAISASNDLTESLRYLGWVNDSFAHFVEVKTAEGRFDANKDKAPLPSRPQGTDVTDYSLFFPISDNARFLIRKGDTNRSVIWTRGAGGWETHKNFGIRPYESIVQRVSKVPGQGAVLKLRPGYVEASALYFAPEAGKQCSIPWHPFVIWCCRNESFPDAMLTSQSTFAELERLTRERLSLTEAEEHFLFTRDWASMATTPADFESSRDEVRYNELLCFDAVTLPKATIVREAKSLSDLQFEAEVIGLSDNPEEHPLALASRLIGHNHLNLLFTGPPRTSKSLTAIEVAKRYLGIEQSSAEWNERVLHVQFHHEWRYGDFIQKLTPKLTGSSLDFSPASGLFLAHCQRPINQHQRSVAIIEEINRANVAAVFGEAFHLVEMGYRGQSLPLPHGGVIRIPPDLLLIATMNDLDRSTYALDYALLARFRTIPFAVDYREMYKLLTRPEAFAEDKAVEIVADIHQIAELTKYPIGHAHFINVRSMRDLYDWYVTVLRPSLELFLTKYQQGVLEGQVDTIMQKYRP